MHSSRRTSFRAWAAPSARVQFPSHGLFIESERSSRKIMQPGCLRLTRCSYIGSPLPGDRSYRWLRPTAVARRRALLAAEPGPYSDRGPWGSGEPRPLVAAFLAPEAPFGWTLPGVYQERPAPRA